MFGSFRPTKVQDQVDLLTCPSNRRYMFEFMIEGRIASDMVLIQFSTLCTNLQGQRYFLIETHCNKVSTHIPRILLSTNYNNVNAAYVRGIVHNVLINLVIVGSQHQDETIAISAAGKMQETYESSQGNHQRYGQWTCAVGRRYFWGGTICQDKAIHCADFSDDETFPAQQ